MTKGGTQDATRTAHQPGSELDFEDSEVAFGFRSTAELRKAKLLFRTFGRPWLVKNGPKAVSWALGMRLPITPLIKNTIFDMFCAGETIGESLPLVNRLAEHGVETILDYSVEAQQSETAFDQTASEIHRLMETAGGDGNLPATVFKMTGLCRFGLLEKVASGEALSDGDTAEFERARGRVLALCQEAARRKLPVMIDAEETWIQDAIDRLAEEMMARFNGKEAVVYTTVQMYRCDRLSYLQSLVRRAEAEGFHVGVKLVRGAYMEKERLRAAQRGDPSPIHPDKPTTDQAYDRALAHCLDHIERVALCAGTHNEASTRYLAAEIDRRGLDRKDPRLLFSQLYGMSDHLTFNLARAGYRVAKYVPYGPVRDVLPYLFRRAEENTSIKGQAGREITLIDRELDRRRREPTSEHRPNEGLPAD